MHMRIENKNRQMKICCRFLCVWGHSINIYQLFVKLCLRALIVSIKAPLDWDGESLESPSKIPPAAAANWWLWSAAVALIRSPLGSLQQDEKGNIYPQTIALSLSLHVTVMTHDTWINKWWCSLKQKRSTCGAQQVECHRWSLWRKTAERKMRKHKWSLCKSRRNNLIQWIHYSVSHSKFMSVRF